MIARYTPADGLFTAHVPGDNFKESIQLDLLPTGRELYDNILMGYDLPSTISINKEYDKHSRSHR